MKRYISILILVCAAALATAQTNFVKNPSFEKYDTCPYKSGQIILAKYWQNAIVPDFSRGVEYFNRCAVGNIFAGCPNNGAFYQYPKSGNGFAGIQLYYDKTMPPPPSPYPFKNRESLQGHLFGNLINGKTYCVSFWVNLAEGSGYGHNKIGAYLDDGNINTEADTAGEEITTVIPQVFTNTVIKDTLNWVKIEGSFVANGTETYITIGNFFTNAVIATVVTNYFHLYEQYSYYLIDDISVIPIDLDADAGKDNWVEIGKQVQIGRVGDTTAEGLDCKWYHKGTLIDSGAIITVNANSVVNAIDTYVVVQTICGLVKTDTVMVKTTGLGIPLLGGAGGGFTIYPNPSSGTLVIANTSLRGTKQSEAIYATIYDLLGRIVQQQNLSFNNKEATIKLNLPSATYILELKDEAGNVQRERVVVQ